MASVPDIAPARRTEAALRDAQSLNALVLNSTRDCIVMLDLDGHTQFVSPGGIEAMEIADVQAILGLSWLRVWTGDDHAAAVAAVAEARAGGIGRFQGFCPTHKGLPKWWDVVVSPMLGPDGRPESLVTVGRDITEGKLAQLAMLESEARFRLLAQAMPNHVWTAKADGMLDWFNDRVYAYGGSAEGSLDGEGWAVLVHPDDLGPTAGGWAAALAAGEQYEVEFRLRRHDGAYRWHIARAVPIRDAAGGVERWVGTNTDIQDQKSAVAALADLAATLEQRVEARTEELLKAQSALRQSQKMESIGNLTGGVAHDFNNLLQVIGGNLQLLALDVAGNDRAERRVQGAIAGVQRGSKLAAQLLAFGRRQPLAPKVVNVGRFVRDMDEILRRALGEAVEIETIVAGGLWNSLLDPANVESALLNLAINARDAMDGQGKLTIEAGNTFLDDAYAQAHADVTAGQYVLLAVSDTGTGMAPELLDKVFEPFFTTKPEGKGTGLGLSMVYGFVKQSGGHIKIYSELGHGTTIKLYLPRSTQSEDVLIDVAAVPVTGGTETILVAEDDEAVRDTVVAMLSDLGYRVLKAKDAQAALIIIESGAPIDLLFTDVVMPGALKSPELARKARERLPGVGVLYTSGYTENAIVHGGRLDENVELLSKPYTREALARKIRQVLANGAARAPAPRTVLVCEDDELIRMNTVEILESSGYRVLEAGDGPAALAILGVEPVDILMTDVGLPGMSGLTLVEQARARLAELAVVFATGNSNLPGITPGPLLAIIQKPYRMAQLTQIMAGIVAVLDAR